MPRRRGKPPAYCRHRASGRAVVRIDGRDHYLGQYGSSDSHAEYERLIAEWRVRQQEQPPVDSPAGTSRSLSSNPAVVEVIREYWRFAKSYYVRDGTPTSELRGMQDALQPVRKLYGRTPAREFGPLALKAVREHLIEHGLCRTEINKRIGRIKRFFKWAVSEELVPASVHHGLQTVTGLRRGRTNARESEKVRPVPDEHVEALLPFVSPPIAAMIQLQRMTGMRPGEVVQMRQCDIDMSEDVWLYEPEVHKNEWRGHHRVVPLGPRAQEVLRPFLDRPADAYLFSPRDVEAWRITQQTARAGSDRKTPVYPSELRSREQRREARRKRKRKRPPRERYDRDSYRRAITYGLQRARRSGVEIPHWHPHQLRHSRGTELRKKYGIEAAQVSLGHARADVTEVYAERNLQRAIDIAAEAG